MTIFHIEILNLQNQDSIDKIEAGLFINCDIYEKSVIWTHHGQNFP